MARSCATKGEVSHDIFLAAVSPRLAFKVSASSSQLSRGDVQTWPCFHDPAASHTIALISILNNTFANSVD